MKYTVEMELPDDPSSWSEEQWSRFQGAHNLAVSLGTNVRFEVSEKIVPHPLTRALLYTLGYLGTAATLFCIIDGAGEQLSGLMMN